MRLRTSLLMGVIIGSLLSAHADGPLAIGNRLEPFVDTYLIASMSGVEHVLNAPIGAETVLAFDKPWEGEFCAYVTAIRDGELIRLYYRGLPQARADGTDLETTCYAVSVDGVHFAKPNLGLFEVNGTRDNNVILHGFAPLSHNFAPFLDTRSDVNPSQRYKALAGTSSTGLVAFVSPDGVHWSKLRDEAVITQGALDSQNVAFWSETEQQYVCYLRTFSAQSGVRTVSRCTSPDFVTWTPIVEMDFGNTTPEHLYTNQTTPYYRAPHIYIGIAARFMPGRRVVTEQTISELGGVAMYSGDCSDAVLLTTRGGTHYDRTFMEGFIRPGIGLNNWTSRTNYPARGVVQTGPNEMSMYVQRNYGQKSHHLQRLVMRIDGLASIKAPYAGGELVTKPLTFTGSKLVLNYATSAAGSIWVELLDETGAPLAGFARTDCDEIVGDEIARVVTWKGSSDLAAHSGKPFSLRIVMKDADLYSLRFE